MVKLNQKSMKHISQEYTKTMMHLFVPTEHKKKNLGPSNFESILKSLTLHILNGNDIS